MQNLKKSGKNKNNLKTIFPKNHEKFKNSKPRVQLVTGSYKKKGVLFKSNKTKFFPSFYRQSILYWKKHLAMMTQKTFLSFVSISAVQCKYPGGLNLYSVFMVFRKIYPLYCTTF